MTQKAKGNDAELVQAKIRAAFPDSVFSGSITPADGRLNEELDEERALYSALHGKKWTDIAASFIGGYPDGVVLLTDEAFATFLPAWLTCALQNKEVRELMVYTFSPREPSERSDRRVRNLTSSQREALRAFLAYCLEVESSNFVKERARRALARVAD
jgi:hypothetical protein